MTGKSSQTASTDRGPKTLDNQELDLEILNSIKTSLQRDFSNWTEVKDRWEKTVVLRQRDLKNSDHANVIDFLKDWPLYSHAHSKDFVSFLVR